MKRLFPVLFKKLFLLIAIFAVFSSYDLKALPDFDFSVEVVKDETCSSYGELKFVVGQTDPLATINFTIYLLPELSQPFKVQETTVLSNLSAGDYRIIATQELDGESTSKQVDVTIKKAFEPLSFNVIAEDMCHVDDGKITIEMVSGTASTYQIEGPVSIGPQASNVFEGLPKGSYTILVTNECDERLSQSFEILETGFSIDDSQVDFVPLLPSCGEITVGHYVSAVGSGIQYPLILDFTVNLPDGGVQEIQTIVEGGESHEGFVYGTLPYFSNSSYTYDIKISDDCGNVVESTNNIIDRKLTVSDNMRWGSGSCGKRQLAITPMNYTAPYTIDFIAYPDGFDPSGNEAYPGPYYKETTLFDNNKTFIPDGQYVFQVTDACGNSSEEITLDHRTVISRPTAEVYQGCGENQSSVQLLSYDFNMIKVEIASAPSSYPHPLPHDVSQNINKNDGRRFSMASLPEGIYEFNVETDCGSNHITEAELIGQKVVDNQVEIIETCSSFNIYLQHESNLTAEQTEKFGLQQWDPETETWVHPVTGEAYVEGQELSQSNSALLFNNATNYNFPFSGTFRVIKTFRNWKNGSEINSGEDNFTYCVNILKEFTSDTSIGFSSINSFKCSDEYFDVAISATGYAPINYKITAKNGIPFLVDNGEDPLFKGLEEGVYAFQIEDRCENILNKTFRVSQGIVPRIIPNICNGEEGELAVKGLDFLEFEWWKEDDPSTILSRNSALSFSPFDVNSDPGVYMVKLTDSDPNSCLNEILEFEIPADDDGAQAGTGGVFDVCEGDIVDLFDLLEGPFDTYGEWKEITATNSLIDNFWTTSGLPTGTYEFIYTVPGLCNDEDQVSLTLNLLSTPEAPIGEPIQGFCEKDSPTVSDLIAEGENISWYLQPTDGTPLLSTEALLDNSIYYAEQNINGCPSRTRLESKISIEKTIENNEIEQDQALGRNKVPELLVGSLPTGGTGVYEYQWEQSLDSLTWEAIPGADQQDYQPEILEETIYYRRVIKGKCINYISNSVKITVVTVEISITKTSFNKEIFDGSVFNYEIFVENNGEFDATTVVVSDELPSNLTYIDSEFFSSSQDISVSSSTNENFVSWKIPFLNRGESVSIQLTVSAKDEGELRNTVGVDSEEEDADPSNNMATDINKVLPLFIPNVIKPDFDGKNEFFIIRTMDKFEKTGLVIFNRWGDHVYESSDYKNDWSAEGLNAGTYYYVINAIDKQGKARVYKGYVQVIKN